MHISTMGIQGHIRNDPSRWAPIDDAQVAKWGTLTDKTKELNTNTNHYSKYTPNIFSKIKAGKGIV